MALIVLELSLVAGTVGEGLNPPFITWTDGTRYEREFKDDKFDGKGVKIFASGTCYEGEFKDSKLREWY